MSAVVFLLIYQVFNCLVACMLSFGDVILEDKFEAKVGTVTNHSGSIYHKGILQHKIVIIVDHCKCVQYKIFGTCTV
jgi:hypothetical protein